MRPTSEGGRGRSHVRRAALALGSLVAVAVAWSEVARAAAPGASVDSVAARAFRLSGAGRADSALALAERALAAARAASDRVAEGRLLGLRGTLHAVADRARPAEADLRAAMRIALEAGNGRGYRLSERWLCYALILQSRLRESDSLYRDLLARSREAGDAEQEGWALIGLSYARLEHGEFAAAHPGYARAQAIFDSLGDSNGSLYAYTGLARVRFEQGEFDQGAAVWRRLIARSRSEGNLRSETYGWNNLGVIMDVVGDPGEASRAYEHSLALAARQGHVWDEAAATANLARQWITLGRLREADSLLALALPRAEQGNFGDRIADLLKQLSEVRRLEGRPRESIALARRALALPHVERSVVMADLLEGISTCYVTLGAPDSALAVLDVEMARFAGKLPPYVASSGLQARARCLLRLGRAREALETVRRVAALDPASAVGGGSPGLLALEARALRALGERDLALEALGRAADAWEHRRVQPRDREWREFFGSTSRQVYGQLADLLLTDASGAVAPAAARQAFDVLQRFKSRTLEEYMRGPHRSADSAAATSRAPFATVETLQRDVLEDGEVLLDAFIGDASCWLFLVTRDTCRVARLPALDALAPRLDRFDRMLAGSGGSASGREAARALDESSAALGAELLGSFRDLLLRSRRVIFAPDGGLNLLPIQSLALAPVADGAASSAPLPLLAGREVVRVPSATLLSRFRHRAGAAATGGALLALAGERGAGGARLEGAGREVRALAGAYRDVLVRPSGTPALAWALRELPGARAIHLAAHTHVDDERPWRSGALLAREDSTGADPWLRAPVIAALQLRADLAVLSGCESAGGHTRSGEGVQGLATAFLEAGVPCVVATLWAVDDATTARLVGEFYRRLARGETAGAALREAQLVLRSNSATRAPFYWAGFVLVGEGGTRLKLVRRNPLAAAALPLGALAVGGAALLVGLRARARRGHSGH